jgi:hypothetical protein
VLVLILLVLRWPRSGYQLAALVAALSAGLVRLRPDPAVRAVSPSSPVPTSRPRCCWSSGRQSPNSRSGSGATRAALAGGLIDERRAEVIAEEVSELDAAHAAAVEKLIIGKAPKLTSGQLRALVRRAVISADPGAARRRKDKALRDARVEMFPETSGTAALAGRDLPRPRCWPRTST